MTVVSMVLVPAALLAGGLASAFVGELNGRVLVVSLLGLPVWAAAYFVSYKLGAGHILCGTVAGCALIVSVLSLMTATRVILSQRGERVTATVVEQEIQRGRRTARERDVRYYCNLTQLDGTPVRPRLSGSACRPLREGQPVRVVVDRSGQVGPLLADDFDSQSWAVPTTVTFVGLQALVIPIAAVRGQRRARG